MFDFNFNRLIVEEHSDNRAIKTIAQGLNRTAPDLLFYSSKPHPEPKGIPYLVAPIESVQELLERKPLKTSLTRRSLWQLFIDLLKGHQSKDNPDDVDKNSQKHY